MIENTNKPKTIKMFLVDGVQNGTKVAEIGNRTIKRLVALEE